MRSDQHGHNVFPLRFNRFCCGDIQKKCRCGGVDDHHVVIFGDCQAGCQVQPLHRSIHDL